MNKPNKRLLGPDSHLYKAIPRSATEGHILLRGKTVVIKAVAKHNSIFGDLKPGDWFIVCGWEDVLPTFGDEWWEAPPPAFMSEWKKAGEGVPSVYSVGVDFVKEGSKDFTPGVQTTLDKN